MPVLTFKTPIIGQEAICPDGLGRVIDFKEKCPNYIQVSTYIHDRKWKWDYTDVILINPMK